VAVSAAVAEAVARAEAEAQARAETEAREAFAAAAAAYGGAAPELQQVSLALTRRRAELAEVERMLSERSAELNTLVASMHDRSMAPEPDREQIPQLDRVGAASAKPIADFTGLDTDLAKIREVLHPGLGRTEPAALTAPDSALTLVLFDSGSATLSVGGRTRIIAAAETLAAMGPTRVRIQAHTDTLGSAEGNAALARARAEAVAAVFVEAGMSREMIDIAALGETPDALPIATPDGVSEPLNRRVGIYPEPTTS
jgi:outer membrane protein OmpA-like peptidoglycan-associated protein